MSALDEALWPRASLPRRPMLGAVLDALTTWESDGAAPPSAWLARGRVVDMAEGRRVLRSPDDFGFGWRCEWTTTDPAEAWEILDARGLIPEGYVGRFVCGRCNGTGVITGWIPCECCGDGACIDWSADDLCTGARGVPATMPDLVAWASLGFGAADDGAPGILGAEELAREIADSLHVWWGVIDRPPQELRGLDPDSPGVRLRDAGFRWYWQGGAVDRTTLYVPPL